MPRRPVHPLLFADRSVPTIVPIVPIANGGRAIGTIVANGGGMISAERSTPAKFPVSADIYPADVLVTYMERLAICLEGGDITQEVAHRVASDQCGRTLDVLVSQQMAFWCDRLTILPEPADKRLARLKSACLAALREEWVMDAIRFGWNETSMFGLDATAPVGQVGNGLVVQIANARLEAPSIVVRLDPVVVVISRRDGLDQRCFNNNDAGPVIWEHPAFRRLH